MEKDMYLTNVGKTMMNAALSGQTIAFVSFAVGEGDPDDVTPEGLKARTALVTPVPGLSDLAITSGVEQSSYVKLKGSFSSQDDFELPDSRTSFLWKELGIYACGQGTQRFVGDGTTTSFVITNATYMLYYVEETVSGTTTVVDPDDYTFDPSTNALVFNTAPADEAIIDVYFPDMSNKQLFAYGYDSTGNPVQHTEDGAVAQSYEISEVFSIDDGAQIVIKLDATGNYVTIDEFNNHTNNFNNPHNVTASQIGITGDSGTSIVNDMKVSFTRASSLTNLTSPATLSSLFGKISKAVYDFISHKGSTSNPHKVTLKQAISQDSSSDPGVVPLSKGGTGVTSLSELQALVGGGGVHVGSYTGNETNPSYTSTSRKIITFESTPKFVYIWRYMDGYTSQGTGHYQQFQYLIVVCFLPSDRRSSKPSGSTAWLTTANELWVESYWTREGDNVSGPYGTCGFNTNGVRYIYFYSL